MGRAISRRIVNIARGYGCQVIAFEHLGNLKPARGKYSRRSNQKRANLLKSKIYLNVKRVAYQDYSILTTRVNPRDTSRLDPWGNQLWRGSDFPTNLLGFLEYQPGADWVAGVNGYKAHSGLNAARNIWLKEASGGIVESELDARSGVKSARKPIRGGYGMGLTE